MQYLRMRGLWAVVPAILLIYEMCSYRSELRRETIIDVSSRHLAWNHDASRASTNETTPVHSDVDSHFCKLGEVTVDDDTPVLALSGGGSRAVGVDVGVFKGLKVAVKDDQKSWPQKVVAVSGAAWFITSFMYADDTHSDDDLLGNLGERDFCPKEAPAFHHCKNLLTALYAKDYTKYWRRRAIGRIMWASKGRASWAKAVHKYFLKKFGIQPHVQNQKRKHAPGIEAYVMVASIYECTDEDGKGKWKRSNSVQLHGFDKIIGDGSNDMRVWQSREGLWPRIMTKAKPAIKGYVGVAESAALSSYPNGLWKNSLNYTGLGGWMKGGFFLCKSQDGQVPMSMSYYLMSDGGNVEGTGVHALLAMGHNLIFSVLNGMGPLDLERAFKECAGPPNKNCYKDHISPMLLQMFFGHIPSALGERLQRDTDNQVFDNAQFPKLVEKLLSSVKSGNGPVAEIDLTTVENGVFGIKAGRKVKMQFMVLFYGMKAEAAFPKNWREADATKAQLESLKNVAERRKWKKISSLVVALQDTEKDVDEKFCSGWGLGVTSFQLAPENLVLTWLFSEMVAWVTKTAGFGLK